MPHGSAIPRPPAATSPLEATAVIDPAGTASSPRRFSALTILAIATGVIVILSVIGVGSWWATTALMASSASDESTDTNTSAPPSGDSAANEATGPDDEGASIEEPNDEDAAPEPSSNDESSAGNGDAEASTTETITLDEQCTIDLDEAERERSDEIRPWNFEACRWAPVVIDSDSDTKWIVVHASLNGDDFDEGEALDRADQAGLTGQVLWSTHYPSLNPDLWVIYDGPFPDEEAATDAAAREGSGAYPRRLSDNEGDRYCVAADGCVGERAD